MRKNFLKFRYFLQEERVIIFLCFLSLALISFFIITSNKPEIIKYGTDIMNVIYDISIALLMGVILYYFQVFLPKVNKRKNAQRELNMLIGGLTDFFGLIIENYSRREDLSEKGFLNSRSKYIYNNIEEVVDFVVNNLKLADKLNFKWNKKQLTFKDEIFNVVKKFNENYDKIILKYNDVLEDKMLESMEKIYRNYIFISIREKNFLQQGDLDKITINKLLVAMKDVKKTMDKINKLVKK